MKRHLFPALLLAAGLFAGTSQLSAAEPRVIEIKGTATLTFDVTAITAAPGEDLKVVLTHAGAGGPALKAAMGHNWVLLKAGTNVAQFAAAAAAAGLSKDYIPAAPQGDLIVAKTKLIGPTEKTEVVFKAPTEPGDYPFICSFAGHSTIMKGILTVKAAN